MGKREILLLAGTTFLALAAVGTIFGLKHFSGTTSKASLEGKNAPAHIRLSDVSPTEATISWSTEEEDYGFISYGETPSLGITAQTEGKELVQSVTLSNLSPETTYYYKVGVGEEIYGDGVNAWSFTTPKTDKVAADAETDTGTGTKPAGQKPSPDTAITTEAELIEALGTANPKYDLNGDGKVNTIDLTIFRDSQ